MRGVVFFGVLAMGLFPLVGCTHEGRAPRQAPASAAGSGAPKKIGAKYLPNAFQIHEKVISGGQPQGEDGFRELHALGVKTIISVDGTKPDVLAARKYQMRYVHMPHGYDGIPELRIHELAKAVRDLPGPIYIHCHHGKHRSPTAAAVACAAVGYIPAAKALGVLSTAGTSPHYAGLYQSAREARRFEDRLLDELQVEYRETAELPPMAEAMVAIEHTFDRLKLISEASWLAPAAHPDLELAHEALLLREHFTELLRSPDAADEPQPFEQLLRQSEASAEALDQALREWQAPGNKGGVPTAVTAAFEQITNNCTNCHQVFRDVPLREKAPAE